MLGYVTLRYVTSRYVSRCENRTSCSVVASNSLFGDTCSTTYKYLEIEYICWKGKSYIRSPVGSVRPGTTVSELCMVLADTPHAFSSLFFGTSLSRMRQIWFVVKLRDRVYTIKYILIGAFHCALFVSRMICACRFSAVAN